MKVGGKLMLKDKKVIAVGDKDGISGPAIEACVKSTGAEVIFTSTQCFACSVTGAMDKEHQEKVMDLTSQYGGENIIVILGGADADASGISAETLIAGDPTEVGPLAGIALGLQVYHMFEPEIKSEIDAAVYDEQCSVLEMILDVDGIINEVKNIRAQYSK